MMRSTLKILIGSKLGTFVFSLTSAWLICCLPGNLLAEEWPQWRGNDRDATINDSSLAKSLPTGQLPIVWRVPLGPGYSGPTVANGLVYVTDRQGGDADTTERVMCFSALDGSIVWQHAYPVKYSIGYQASGPRAAVTISDGNAYSVGGMGMLHCLDAKSGKVLWSHDLNAEYEVEMPIWGISAAPLVHSGLVIQIVAGRGNACVVAFDQHSGKEHWRAIDEKAGYSSPVLVQQGTQNVVVCWTGESVTGLDPETGKTLWTIPFPSRNMPIGIATPVVQGDKLLVTSFYDGAMLIQFDQTAPNAKMLWHRVGVDEKNTQALHSIISTPLIKKDFIYGIDSYGELRCLKIDSGDRVWEDTSVVPRARWATVHMIQNGEREIMLNDRGELLLTTLSPEGIQIHSRSQLISPTTQQLRRRDGVVWSHPAIANGFIFARNDKELVSADIRERQQ